MGGASSLSPRAHQHWARLETWDACPHEGALGFACGGGIYRVLGGPGADTSAFVLTSLAHAGEPTVFPGALTYTSQHLPLVLISKQINLHIGSKRCEFLHFYSRNKSWASVHLVNHIIFCRWSFRAIIVIRTFLLPESVRHPPKLGYRCN